MVVIMTNVRENMRVQGNTFFGTKYYNFANCYKLGQKRGWWSVSIQNFRRFDPQTPEQSSFCWEQQQNQQQMWPKLAAINNKMACLCQLRPKKGRIVVMSSAKWWLLRRLKTKCSENFCTYTSSSPSLTQLVKHKETISYHGKKCVSLDPSIFLYIVIISTIYGIVF